jgi:hypothetical protein
MEYSGPNLNVATAHLNSSLFYLCRGALHKNPFAIDSESGTVCHFDANGTPHFHGAMASLAEIPGNLQFENTPRLRVRKSSAAG